jgi:hypothetical protein
MQHHTTCIPWLARWPGVYSLPFQFADLLRAIRARSAMHNRCALMAFVALHAGAPLDELRYGVFTCSNFPVGYFNACAPHASCLHVRQICTEVYMEGAFGSASGMSRFQMVRPSLAQIERKHRCAFFSCRRISNHLYTGLHKYMHHCAGMLMLQPRTLTSGCIWGTTSMVRKCHH